MDRKLGGVMRRLFLWLFPPATFEAGPLQALHRQMSGWPADEAKTALRLIKAALEGDSEAITSLTGELRVYQLDVVVNTIHAMESGVTDTPLVNEGWRRTVIVSAALLAGVFVAQALRIQFDGGAWTPEYEDAVRARWLLVAAVVSPLAVALAGRVLAWVGRGFSR